jgi:hypothetical protein
MSKVWLIRDREGEVMDVCVSREVAEREWERRPEWERGTKRRIEAWDVKE